MKAAISILVILSITLGLQSVQGQCVGNFYRFLNPNNVSARINNLGEQFASQGQYGQYSIPDTTGLSPIAFSNLWIGGLNPQGQMHLAATEVSHSGADFKVGPYRSTSPYTCQASFETATVPFSDGIKVLSNGKILALDSLQVLIYDPITKQILTRPWPTPRGWVDALELNDGRVMFFGDDLYPTKNPMLFMDTVTYTLTGGPILNWFHKKSSATELLDGRVLLAGVVGCEVWNPTTNQSTAVPDMIYPRMMHAAVRIPNGDVMVFGGGSSLNGSGYTLATQRFDDSLGYWFPGPDLSQASKSPAAVTLPDGRIYIFGGSSNAPVANFYDPVFDSILPAPATIISADETNAYLLPNGDVAVTYRYPQGNLGEIIFLDPDSNFVGNVTIEDVGLPMAVFNGYDAVVNMLNSTRCVHLDLRTSFQYDNRWQFIWSMSRAEIDQFRSDFLANAVDFERYPEIEIWPAHGSVADGENRNLAPFVDVNGDGLYRPAADGDYPCIVGDKAMWWVLNDQGMHEESGGLPMDLQVEVMAYGFDCSQTPCPDPALNDATFFHYEFTNHSDTTWSDMYVGGYYGMQFNFLAEKFVGSDSALELAFGYNGDNIDDFFYGTPPPAWGATVLPNGHIDHMTSFIAPGMAGPGFERYPARPEEFYGYLKGQWADSLPLVDNGYDGYPGSGAGPATAFAYPSTTGFCGDAPTGWSELTAARAPGIRQFVQGSGPFSLQSGDEIDYDLGFFFTQDSSNLFSVCALKDATATIRDWWQNQLDRSCWSMVVGREEPLVEATFRVIPNPAGGGTVQADFGEALSDAGELQVLDLHGKIVLCEHLQAGAVGTRLDVSRFARGMYLLRLQAGDRVATQRLVLQ